MRLRTVPRHKPVFPAEGSNPTMTEENWRGLIHMSEREKATKRTTDTANYGMLCHQYLQGWQKHRLLHLDQGTRAVLGARNAPLQEFYLRLGCSLLLSNCNAQK